MPLSKREPFSFPLRPEDPVRPTLSSAAGCGWRSGISLIGYHWMNRLGPWSSLARAPRLSLPASISKTLRRMAYWRISRSRILPARQAISEGISGSFRIVLVALSDARSVSQPLALSPICLSFFAASSSHFSSPSLFLIFGSFSIPYSAFFLGGDLLTHISMK